MRLRKRKKKPKKRNPKRINRSKIKVRLTRRRQSKEKYLRVINKRKNRKPAIPLNINDYDHCLYKFRHHYNHHFLLTLSSKHIQPLFSVFLLPNVHHLFLPVKSKTKQLHIRPFLLTFNHPIHLLILLFYRNTLQSYRFLAFPNPLPSFPMIWLTSYHVVIIARPKLRNRNVIRYQAKKS